MSDNRRPLPKMGIVISGFAMALLALTADALTRHDELEGQHATGHCGRGT